MKAFLLLITCLSFVSSKLLIDYSASRGDEPSVLGQINLEEARGVPGNVSTDLFFKKGADWLGNNAANVHRKAGFIRAEYHGLKGKIEAKKTYYIGYTFALQELQQSLMIWQWKEYAVNNDVDKGANIPLSLEIVNGDMVFQHQDCSICGRNEQFKIAIKPHVQYTVGIEIYTDNKVGTARFFLNGKIQTMTADCNKGSTVVKGNMFPGEPSPKWGAYRGEEVEINTWIYDVQVGLEKGDMNAKYGF